MEDFADVPEVMRDLCASEPAGSAQGKALAAGQTHLRRQTPSITRALLWCAYVHTAQEPFSFEDLRLNCEDSEVVLDSDPFISQVEEERGGTGAPRPGSRPADVLLP